MSKKKWRLAGRQLPRSSPAVTKAEERTGVRLRSKSSLSRWLNSNKSMTFDDERGAVETMGSSGSEPREEVTVVGWQQSDHNGPQEAIVPNNNNNNNNDEQDADYPTLSKSAKQRRFLAKLKEISGRHVESLPEERKTDGGASWRMSAPSPVNTPEFHDTPTGQQWAVPITPPLLSKSSKTNSKGSGSNGTNSSMHAVATSVQAVVRSVSTGCVSFQDMCTSHEQVLFGDKETNDLINRQQCKMRETYIDRMPKELLRETSPPDGKRNGAPPMPASISFVKRDEQQASQNRSSSSRKDSTIEETPVPAESRSFSPNFVEDKYKVQRDTSLLSSIMIVTDYGPGNDDDSMTSSIPTRHSHHLYSPP